MKNYKMLSWFYFKKTYSLKNFLRFSPHASTQYLVLKKLLRMDFMKTRGSTQVWRPMACRSVSRAWCNMIPFFFFLTAYSRWWTEDRGSSGRSAELSSKGTEGLFWGPWRKSVFPEDPKHYQLQLGDIQMHSGGAGRAEKPKWHSHLESDRWGELSHLFSSCKMCVYFL